MFERENSDFGKELVIFELDFDHFEKEKSDSLVWKPEKVRTFQSFCLELKQKLTQKVSFKIILNRIWAWENQKKDGFYWAFAWNWHKIVYKNDTLKMVQIVL